MYDKTDKVSILNFAKKLEGRTFYQILQESEDKLSLEVFEQSSKSDFGHIIETYYFGIEQNSLSLPDFTEAKVELKVSPIKKLNNNEIKAGERLVISMIPYTKEIEDDFEFSSVFQKINNILFVLYLRDKLKNPNRLDYPIQYVDLFSFYETLSKEDQLIIKQDYYKIQSKIKSGLAHELSEGDTLYLGACTKGATAKSSYRVQYLNDEVKAKGRAFSFKQSFFSRLINEHIIDKRNNEEKIVKNSNDLEKASLEEIILKRISKYVDKTETELFNNFSLNTNAKNKYSLLAFRMLDVKSNSAEEFIKAGIIVKTIRMEENNSIKEHMSFPNFNLIEFANEEWMESNLYNLFRETKFLFLIFKKNDNKRIFKGAQFWNMPISDLDTKFKNDWLKTQKIVRDGIKFQLFGQKIGNNIPTPLQTEIFHIRPKARESAYQIYLNGKSFTKGNIERDSDLLPDGQRMTKQCYWLNKEYVIKQIEEKFKV